MPSWENYKITVEVEDPDTGKIKYEPFELKYDLEEETLIEEVAIKGLSSQEITDMLVDTYQVVLIDPTKKEDEPEKLQDFTTPNEDLWTTQHKTDW